MTEQPEPESSVLVELRNNVAVARRDLLTSATPGVIWACHHCEHVMPSPAPGQWLRADELRRQAGRLHKQTGAVLQIALLQMIKDGELEMGNDLRVRIPGRTRDD